MNKTLLLEEPQEAADWTEGMIRMVNNPRSLLVFGDRRSFGKIFNCDQGGFTLGIFRLKDPDGAHPWGVENVAGCETVMWFKTREALDTVRSWLAKMDTAFLEAEKTQEVKA
jgi:hypothetical protein